MVFLLQLFMQFGIPKVVTSDQGSKFNNNMDKKLMKLLNIDHRLTSPYHPQVRIQYSYSTMKLYIIFPYTGTFVKL